MAVLPAARRRTKGEWDEEPNVQHFSKNRWSCWCRCWWTFTKSREARQKKQCNDDRVIIQSASGKKKAKQLQNCYCYCCQCYCSSLMQLLAVGEWWSPGEHQCNLHSCIKPHQWQGFFMTLSSSNQFPQVWIISGFSRSLVVVHLYNPCRFLTHFLQSSSVEVSRNLYTAVIK